MGDGAAVDTAPPDSPRRAVDRSVRVRTEVAALSKAFDYAVPESWSHDVRVGTRVRVPLHGRSVRGWIVADGVAERPTGSTFSHSSHGSAGARRPALST